ncbi:Ribonuclease H2 subunit A [Porphyridium purpureum]|uniref:Ribonuclease n=1 Tax=Porphyridium purpureum TaxID=35688 RepID=A0A5J4Z3T4_PORPP|nr:Ribonuclease H2 subunit A [Porphyridium purpureum]|eukprot:POR6957..scf295_1
MSRTAFAFGIDEAGRGPVLGPLVYAGAAYPAARVSELRDWGCDDSKQISAASREALYSRIEQSAECMSVIDVLSAELISEQMLAVKRVSLNKLSHDSAIGLVERALAQGINITELYVDTVGPPEKYESLLQSRFPRIRKVVVSKKADHLFPVVSAASIVVKVTRDRILSEWQFSGARANSYGRVFGSGYPGDPSTKAWLRAHLHPVFGFPNLVRFSWSTIPSLLESEGAVSVSWRESENEQDEFVFGSTKANTSTRKITSYFQRVPAPSTAGGKVAKAKHRPKFLVARQIFLQD